MKLKDYLKQFEGLDPEMEVAERGDEMELRGALIPYEGSPRVLQVFRRRERFRDAFDNTEFVKEVFAMTNEKEGEQIVVI